MYVFVRKLKMYAMVAAQTDIVFLCSHGGVIFYIGINVIVELELFK